MSEGSLRSTLGQFATGVTIVTGRDDEGVPFGMTANSFASVSMDPPWVLWNIAKTAQCFDRFMQAQHFAIQILATDQRALASQFATRLDDKFSGVEWHAGDHELPLFDGVVARLICRQARLLDGGDHTIVVGEVESHAITNDCDPLVFYDGGFRDLRGESKT